MTSQYATAVERLSEAFTPEEADMIARMWELGWTKEQAMSALENRGRHD